MIIISGYQGVGKSTFVDNNKDLKVLDLESSTYGRDNKEWYKDYVNDILSHKDKLDVIFISSHQVVRDHLDSLEEKFYFVLPDPAVKDIWTYQLAKRATDNNYDSKDMRALMSHILYYDLVIDELHREKRANEALVWIENVVEFKNFVIKALKGVQ